MYGTNWLVKVLSHFMRFWRRLMTRSTAVSVTFTAEIYSCESYRWRTQSFCTVFWFHFSWVHKHCVIILYKLKNTGGSSIPKAHRFLFRLRKSPNWYKFRVYITRIWAKQAYSYKSKVCMPLICAYCQIYLRIHYGARNAWWFERNQAF